MSIELRVGPEIIEDQATMTEILSEHFLNIAAQFVSYISGLSTRPQDHSSAKPIKEMNARAITGFSFKRAHF